MIMNRILTYFCCEQYNDYNIMSKNSRKKARRKKTVAQTLPQQKERSIEKETQKRRKKTALLYLMPLFIIIIAVAFYAIFSRPQRKITRNSELNVLLVTLDTTRADRIGCYGYERVKTANLDLLASNGVRFANAYCQVPLTLPSHCSLLTGTYPIFHRVHNNGSYYLDSDFVTLAEILKDNGFKTAAFVSSFTVDSRFGLDQGFDFYDDNFLEGRVLKNFMSERKAEKVFTSFSSWLDENYGQKFFCWVHFFDPHIPYDPPSPFKEEYSNRPYDGEIAYMDHYIGKTIDKLREKNIIGDTLVILVGDHGEALGEKNEVDHGLYIYNVTMRVPFIFYLPNYLPQELVVDSKVRLIDVMPTVLDMLKIKSVEEVQGVSLLPYMTGRKKDDLPSYIESYLPREYYGWSELTGLINGDWKYIKAPKPELYNLRTDPQEEKNVYNKEKKIAASMIEELNTLLEKYSSGKEAGKRKLTREEEARLRSLGYMAGEFSGGTSIKDLPDPKDKINEYSMFAHARRYEYEKDYERAERNYKELLRLNPDIPWNYVHLALLYEKMERLDEAIQIMEQGRKGIPDSIVILSRLSLFYMKKIKPEEAFETSQVILRIDPKYFDALYISGITLVNMGKWMEALDYFKKTLEIEPENKSLRMQYAYCLTALDRGRDALKVYLHLKEEYPDDPTVYRELGILYDSMGDSEKALENLRKAVDLNPSPNTYFNFAVVLEKSGDLKEAIHYLRLYLETTREGNTSRKEQARKALTQWEARLRRR